MKFKFGDKVKVKNDFYPESTIWIINSYCRLDKNKYAYACRTKIKTIPFNINSPDRLLNEIFKESELEIVN